MAAVTSVDSANASTALLLAKVERAGASVVNTDANVLYILIGAGSASASNYSVALATGDYWETPRTYKGEALTGFWAANGSGAAKITEFF